MTIVVIGLVIAAILFPNVLLLGIAKTLTRLHGRYRRHLVRKYGTQLANEYHRYASRQLKKAGFTQAECDAVYSKRFAKTVEEMGTKFVHEHFGPPTGLSRLVGEAV